MLTPDAKKLLAETIRGTAQTPEKGIRARLLRAIHDEADRRYRLSVPIAEAGLDETHHRRRARIEAWLDECARSTKPRNKAELKAATERLLAQAENEAASTLVNRLVLLRHLEALGLSKPAVLTGGWSSKGYREFREFAPTLCTNGTTDATEGYSTLLLLIFDELAEDLPGLYGDVGLTRLFQVPAATLREVVERLDEPELACVWTDDTSLGWVYQFWNDFERDALDAKALDGEKIEPHEIASKTQMFTDRYIVEWLLQNSLGVTWLAMCKKQGWVADADRVILSLDARREEWRKRRDANDVALDALMPIEGEIEENWKYYVPQPISDRAVRDAPKSVRAIKLLDPACGSGHFLIIAFGLLVALYREEARHLGTKVTDAEIAENILEENLHGIDVDPRAIQIAAAGLYLKAKELTRAARPKKLNLVAPVLKLGSLAADDPAVVVVRKDLKEQAGIPEELTTKLLSALAGVDYLGSLLKVDAAVEDAIRDVELEFERAQGQGDLFNGYPVQQVRLSLTKAKATILDKLDRFLSTHSKSEDLGLRLDGEQVAAGVRFSRMVREGSYDVVVGNPPYQGLAKTNALGYVAQTYPRGKADLCAAFLERGLQLTRPGGLSAMVAMRGWMFMSQFTELRRHLLHAYDLRTMGDLDKGAFESMPTSQLISVSMTVFRKSPRGGHTSIALQPTAPGEKFWGPDRTELKRAAVLVQRNRYEFDPSSFATIEGEPIVYWWSAEFLAKYSSAPKLGDSAQARKGLCTGDDARFIRFWWEVQHGRIALKRCSGGLPEPSAWAPTVKGGKGRIWFEPLVDVVRLESRALELQVMGEQPRTGTRFQNAEFFFRPGVAFTMIGSGFAGRAHRYRSVFGNKGSSVFPEDVSAATCLLNSSRTRYVLESLNPGIGFEVGDVNRLPVFPIASADSIFSQMEESFNEHESTREASVEFRRPGPSAWSYAQGWGQKAVDRPDGAPLPSYEPAYDEPAAESLISFDVGVAMGRFSPTGEGLVDMVPHTSLPGGICFLSIEGADSLDDPACGSLRARWSEHGSAVAKGDELRTYLRKYFFEFHKNVYDDRPIYFPLSSAKKSFVALVSIHRWGPDTLNIVLADHLLPAKRRLEGEVQDLRVSRASGTSKGKAEKRFTDVQKLIEELNDFIAKVIAVAEKGPPPPDDKTTQREVDARHAMDLDDGVMVNSAALWPLLETQWKDPKKWWKEFANAQGKKDYDWSHLAARYFPTRVRQKCHEDPSLAVAHHCFWELHPANAYAKELRLQDEIRPGFTIDEPSSDAARAEFLAERAQEAREILNKELNRREKKSAKADEDDEPLLNQEADQPDEGTDD